MPPRSAKKESVSDTPSQASESLEKDKESRIPIKQSSKQISKQSKIPAPRTKSSLASSSKKVSPELVTPVNLKFGKKSSVTAKSKTEDQEKSKNIPVVIDIDLDSDEETEKQKSSAAPILSGPKLPAAKVTSRKTLKEPEKVGTNQRLLLQTKSGIQLEEVDWKSKYEALKKKYLEQSEERKQLDIKIPNMIEEFQNCLSVKENMLRINGQKLKENEKTLQEKEKRITELGLENNVHIKNSNDTVKKNESLKKDLKVKDEEIQKLKEKLQEATSHTAKIQEDVRRKNEETAKLFSELEGLKPKMKSQMELNANLAKQNREKDENIEKLNEKIVGQFNREEDYRARLSKLQEEIEKSKEANLEAVGKMTILEADLKLHINLVEEKDEEMKRVSENFGKIETEKETLKSQLRKNETELKSAKESLTNISKIKSQMIELMRKTERQHETITNQKVALNNQKEMMKEQNATYLQLSLEKKAVTESLKQVQEEKSLMAQMMTRREQSYKESQDKMMKEQSLTYLQARNDIIQLNAEKKAVTESLKQVQEEKSQMAQMMARREQSYKESQDKLHKEINGLELNNFNKKERIVLLESQLKTLKGQLKESIQFVPMETAVKKYLEILERRKEEHLIHDLCSQAADTPPDEDSFSLQEETISVVNNSQEEDVATSLDEHPLDIPDREITLEDIDEDTVIEPPDTHPEEVSFPDNMLTYLWPVSLQAKMVIRSADKKKEEEGLVLGKESLRGLKCGVVSLKRKSEDSSEIASRKRSRTLAGEDPGPVLQIMYNWPLVPHQRRGSKRSPSHLETTNRAKRIKVDRQSPGSDLSGPERGILVTDICEQALHEVIGIVVDSAHHQSQTLGLNVMEDILEIVVRRVETSHRTTVPNHQIQSSVSSISDLVVPTTVVDQEHLDSAGICEELVDNVLKECIEDREKSECQEVISVSSRTTEEKEVTEESGEITEDLVHDDENTESLEDLKDGTVAEDNLLAISELMEEILEQVHTVHSNKSVTLILKALDNLYQ